MKKRERFGSRFAVIAAMAGSAVGLGNIWRFPYVLGQYGGAAFILVYIAASLLVALPIFFAESVIGRRSGRDTYGAMQLLAPGTAWKWAGLLTILSPLLILSYYSVVGGWSVEFLFKSLSFSFTEKAAAEEVSGYFGQFISSTWQPILSHTLFMALVAGVVLGGVKNGIERFSKVAMPLLFVLILFIVGYSLTLPGSRAGVEYLVKPDFSKLTADAYAAALGQAFFSLSLGVGTVLTYASYVKKEENLVVSGVGTAVSDLLFAMIAAFAVMPAVFAAGIEPGSGPGLVFQTLPYIFNTMSQAMPITSALVSIAFFLTILAAALTSAISMLEVGVAYLVDEKGMERRKATLLLALGTWLLGVLCSLSFGPLAGVKLLGLRFFDFLDSLCSVWLLPLGGLLFTLFVGWWMSKADVRDELTNGGTCNVRLFGLVYFLMRYLAPVGIVVVFLTNLFL
ncbi:MAG: sodium-dependent transporter [Candidatus Cryptobacteroides sp.]|nr:sodium-dependent transporter [Candidatus Cryptobacteroides sp.]